MHPLLRLRTIALCCVLPLAAQAAEPTAAAAEPATAAPRNLVLMLGDGMGFAQVKAYRYYADDPTTHEIEPLPFDRLLVGAVASDSIASECGFDFSPGCARDPYGITDSASSATAYASGRDTHVGSIGVSSAGKPMETILEAARKRGKATGLVATSQVTHATPAAFVAHVEGREDYNNIADQMFDNQWQGRPMVDVLLGGGVQNFRREGRDLVAEFEKAGYALAGSREELLAVDAERVLGLFAPVGLPRAWDRSAGIPSLADMTQVALKSLQKNPQGFFLLIEGSQIDWAAHGNDMPGVISEMEDFNAAIKVALDFAAGRDDTLVIITADHETGGMSLGIDDVYSWDPRPLRGLKRTPAAMTEEFLNSTQTLAQVVSRYTPFTLTAEETEELNAVDRDAPPGPDDYFPGMQIYLAICAVFDARTRTGWSTLGHTGVDVPLYATGPGSERFRGVLENEQLGRMMREILLP